MAKKILSTDFKDDVLASTMSEKRRYREIQNIDGTVSFEDVTDYTQIGSTFGAGQINAMNEAANNSFDASKIIDDYDTLLANTQSGYAAGALAVKELNSNLSQVYCLGTGDSFNIQTLLPKVDYTKLTANNFIVEHINVGGAVGTQLQSDWDAINLGAHAYLQTDASSISKSYNKTTGVFTVGNKTVYSHVTSEKGLRGSVSSPIGTKTYLIMGEINVI